MNLPRYEDHETDFLEAMATHFCFTGKNRLVFVKRFREQYAELNDKTFADEWENDLLEGTKGNEPEIVLRERLKSICKKLEDEGCDFKKITKGRWKIGKAWLRNELFPQWAKARGLITETLLTLEQLWNQLKLKATPTDKMRPEILPEISTLDMFEPLSDDGKKVKLGSQIQFHLELETTGYLILLDKGTSGRLWCLCPSFFAPQSYLKPGKVVLPQENSKQKSFKVSGIPGKEEIVAIIAPNSPTIDWLPKPDQNPLPLQECHLQELLKYLEGCPKSSILYMDYTVTLP
ncbi:MAG: hypothetical protein RLZZ338_4705 [Cyanobacteriota bacterium]|jgi:hypothetical protein